MHASLPAQDFHRQSFDPQISAESLSQTVFAHQTPRGNAGVQAVLRGVRVLMPGPADLKKKLLCFYLQHVGGADCRLEANLVGDGCQVASKPLVALLDVSQIDRPHVLKAEPLLEAASDLPVALLDLDPATGLERLALDLGVRGLFYSQDPLPLLLKGLHALSRGQAWVPRKVLEDYLLNHATGGRGVQASKPLLSGRQEEILLLVRQGLSNRELAAHLNLSIHTIKAHLHQIFKRIGVVSRMQAVRWAEENIL